MASKKEVHASSAGEAIVNFFKDFKNYFTDFGKAISNGDAAVKLSTVLMGA